MRTRRELILKIFYGISQKMLLKDFPCFSLHPPPLLYLSVGTLFLSPVSKESSFCLGNEIKTEAPSLVPCLVLHFQRLTPVITL